MTAGLFAYKAHARDGRVVAGVVEAPSRGDAFSLLRDRAVVPFDLRPASGRDRAGRRGRGRAVPPAALAAFLEGLATLLEAKLVAEAALGLLAGEAGKGPMRGVAAGMQARLVDGAALSEAMAEHPLAFPGHVVASVRAGEASGHLAGVVRDLSDGAARELALRQKLASALVYPGFLVAATLAVLGIIVAVLVPAVAPLFEGTAIPPPLALVALTEVGRWASLPAAWAAAAAGAAALAWAARAPGLAAGREALLFRLPLLGAFLADAELARFAGTLGVLLKGGTPVDRALPVAAGTLRAARSRRGAAAVLEAVTAGEPASEAMRRSALAPEAALHVLRVAEEGGALAQGFDRLARLAEARVQRGSERLVRVLTPTLTLVVGVVVGLVIVSIMDAVLRLNEVAFG